jgi:hypothetical protein
MQQVRRRRKYVGRINVDRIVELAKSGHFNATPNSTCFETDDPEVYWIPTPLIVLADTEKRNNGMPVEMRTTKLSPPQEGYNDSFMAPPVEE